MACWIGGGFCKGDGLWGIETAEDGTRQLVHLGDAGRGVNRQLLRNQKTGLWGLTSQNMSRPWKVWTEVVSVPLSPRAA
jgi:hypothetical protein